MGGDSFLILSWGGIHLYYGGLYGAVPGGAAAGVRVHAMFRARRDTRRILVR